MANQQNPSPQIVIAGRKIPVIVVVIVVVAIVVGLTEASVSSVTWWSTATGTGNEKLLVLWTATGPIIGLATLAVLLASVIAAFRLISVTRDSARISLTDEVLNAEWMLKAMDALNDVFGQVNNDPNSARKYCNDVFANPRATPKSEATFKDLLRIQGAYSYLARLYARDVLDEQLLIESSASAVVQGMWMMQDVMRSQINSGFYDDDILEFARACLTRFRRRPEALVFYPMFRDWTL